MAAVTIIRKTIQDFGDDVKTSSIGETDRAHIMCRKDGWGFAANG